jgi:hypothetical protein
MAADEKMLKALRTAITHVDSSIRALNKKDEGSFADALWHVAAELEYALFLLSMKFQDESSTSKWKPNPELKKIDTSRVLVEARGLLNEAEKQMLNEKLLDSYKNAHIARLYVLRIQEDLAKKKREALKKK